MVAGNEGRGIELYLLNRGETAGSVPESAHLLRADIRSPETVRRAIGELTFAVGVEALSR
ncbi:hypothetical protein BH23GEM5_BH23GEM5_28310 [soil metagenome]